MSSRVTERERRRAERVETESRLAPPPPPRRRTRNALGQYPNPRRRNVSKFEGLGLVGMILFALLWLLCLAASVAFWVFVILVIGDALNMWNAVGFV
jgi:hypothetical protein